VACPSLPLCVSASRRRSLVLAAVLALTLPACGKKGPPLPPIRIQPAPPRAVLVRQVGDQVIISAVVPMVRTDGTPLGEGVRVRVLRMPGSEALRAGAVSQRYLLRQFERQAKVVVTLQGEALARAHVGGRLRVADAEVLAAARGAASPRFLYSLQIVESSGKRSPLAPPLPIQVSEPPPAPRGLTLTPAEGEVRLAWEKVEAPKGGVEPRGYNVYRGPAESAFDPEEPLNPQPLEAPTYVDASIRYGESYRYFVRTVGNPGPPRVESADSDPVQVRPLDVYPPSTPTGLAVTAEGTAIKIYWFPNSEPDLAGYRIYRRRQDQPTAELLGAAGPTETSYADTTARPGVRYYYVVTAIDGATPPNESGRSEERSDILPLPAGRPAGPAVPPAPQPSPSPEPPGGQP
jgi:hypothetical protein